MRNLKKILALVLALVMVVGMMTVASAATAGTKFVDDASITKFDESIQILTALGIYEGDENAAFNPNNTITRAEVATLVYRVLTGDVSGKYVNIYSDYNQFADVDANAWYAGYVNFCANAGMLKGDGTNFYPMEKVTGYQVLAIMLRVIGYGQEGEYEGANWHIRTASKAAELDITKNIVAGTLGAYSTRAMVAEMIYRAIAQTHLVEYNRVYLYTPVWTTYAYEKFGLYGTDTSYEGKLTRALAEIDNKYDEPVAYWNANVTGGKIAIRFNTVGTWNTYATDSTLFAAGGFSGYTKDVYSYSIDGEPQTPGTLEKSEYYQNRDFGGTGVVTEMFVADGRVFIVEKNTYVDQAKTTWHAAKKHYDLSLASGTQMHTEHWYTDLANNTIVIYNMYNGKADNYTIHAAKSQNVVVSHTYDKGIADASYFVAGGVKFGYNSEYTVCGKLPQVILNRDEVSYDLAKGAMDAFDANQTVYFDDFGNVIFTHDTVVKASSNEKGYVFVRSAAYGGQVADNRWVSSYTVITADGQASTIKGATNENGYWTTQVAASDADFDLGLYAYEVKNGYYALTKVDASAKSHIIANTEDWAGAWSTPILAGDADAVNPTIVLDDNTMFIIANYDKTGMITGYSCVKGFKNIPDLKGDMYIETVFSTKYNTIELVLVLGATQENPDDTLATKDVYFYLADTTPEDFVVTYDTHKVIVNGVATTMQFVPNLVLDNNLTTGFYKVTKTQAKTGYVSQVAKAPDMAKGVWYADGVIALVNVNDKGEVVAITGYITVAENCAFYVIGDETVNEAAFAEMGVCDLLVVSTNDYGYATAIYVG